VTFVSAVAPAGVAITALRWDAAAGVVDVEGERAGARFADRLAVSAGGVDWSRR
jgi:hypothetical protein